MRIRRSAPLAVVLLSSVIVTLVPGVAHATVTASFVSGTLNVRGDGADDVVVVNHDAGGTIHVIVNGSQIPVSFGPATLTTTDTIDIDLGAGDDTLTIDMSNGLFQPGATSESTGVSEIEFTGGSIEVSPGEALRVLGQDGGNDDIRVQGFDGINLNGDDDADDLAIELVTPTNAFHGQGGDDEIHMSGPFGDGCVLLLVPTTLIGGSGSDHLAGGGSQDRISGGFGWDILEGVRQIPGCIGMEQGVFQDDIILGGPGADVLRGDAGGDVAIGGDGDDDIDGQTGADRVRGGAGTDTVTGGTGDDVQKGGGGNDIVNGGGGNDDIDGQTGADTLRGGFGSDTVSGGRGADILRGGRANDTLNADDGAPGDRVDGDDGTDTCNVDPGDQVGDCEIVA